jgi:hypothetical protein
MSSPLSLKLDWVKHEAARYAVEKWHYSKRMPSTYTKPVCIGVWEEGQFSGAIVFSMSSAKDLGKQYGFTQFERCELIRVALRPGHKVATSKTIAIALRMVQKQSPGLNVVFSFADTAQGHHGGIYQAGGWRYLGKSAVTTEYFINGRKWHARAVTASFGHTEGFEKVVGSEKHRYAYPLNKEAAAKVKPFELPYPARKA